jgi:hypothetical protein
VIQVRVRVGPSSIPGGSTAPGVPSTAGHTPTLKCVIETIDSVVVDREALKPNPDPRAGTVCIDSEFLLTGDDRGLGIELFQRWGSDPVPGPINPFAVLNELLAPLIHNLLRAHGVDVDGPDVQFLPVNDDSGRPPRPSAALPPSGGTQAPNTAPEGVQVKDGGPAGQETGSGDGRKAPRRSVGGTSGMDDGPDDPIGGRPEDGLDG